MAPAVGLRASPRRDRVGSLAGEQWRTPSLCAGWTVREVAAHLVPSAESFGTLGILWQVVRDRAGVRLDPPVTRASGPMTDTAVHLRDAARPLGLATSPEPPAWRPVLDFLVATDQDWTSGEGDEVRGTSEALALGVAGRGVVLPELDGAGASVLGARLDAD